MSSPLKNYYLKLLNSHKPFLISGPCVIESRDHCLFMAENIKKICDELEIEGCTDNQATNYNPLATEDDSSCEYIYYGCTNSLASNYNIDATDDDGSCIFCNDINADNYYAGDDGSFCTEDVINNYTLDSGSDGLVDCCFYINPGCTDDGSCVDADGDGDFDECDDRFLYTNEDGESVYYPSPFPGVAAVNYNPSANQLIGVNFCYYFVLNSF